MYTLTPIGYIQSCFKEKFAIPRQPLLAPAAKGILELIPPFNASDALVGLEQVSHIWLLFIFHQCLEEKPRLKVRPPRLGGNRSLGVFATRSTFRPNGLGQSVVKLDRIDQGKLYLSGIDLLDGTPVIDIKPYIPYADIVPNASNQIASESPNTIKVHWQTDAFAQAKQHAYRLQQPLVELIEQCLCQDPRPAYQKPEPTRIYGVTFWDVNIRWHYPSTELINILSVEPEYLPINT